MMASQKFSPKDKDEPRCVICSLSFYFKEPTNPYGAKCPHILHCGHSTCEGCLTSALQNKTPITCPVCNTLSESKKFFDPRNTKKSEILSLREEFPLNVYAVGQVTLKRYKQRTGDNLIKFCSKNKNVVDKYSVHCNECNERVADCSCRQCETDLCSTCFSNIHNSVTLRKHEKISIQDKQTNELFEENTCKKHKGLFQNIFCKDCELYICKECMVQDHLPHTCSDVFQQNEEKLPEFEELFKEANGVLKQLFATKKKLQNPIQQPHTVDEEVLKVERQVQTHFAYLHGLLQRQEGELLRKIRAASDATHQSLQAVVDEVDNNIKEVEHILVLSNCTITSNKLNEIPLGCLVEKLRNITGTPCHLVFDNEENFKFEFNVNPRITDAITNHCTVNVPDNRVYELRSSSDLPESYEPDSTVNIREPFILPDLRNLKSVKEESRSGQNALLSAIDPALPQSPPKAEAKTKSQELVQKGRPGWQQKNSKGNQSSSSSVASHDSSLDRICREPLTEGTTEIVSMCHFLTPNNFYVQRKCNVGEITKLRDYFSKNANRSKSPPATIEFGQIYLVLFGNDKKWYRGRVTRVDGNVCDIFFVDYGNVEANVNKNRLRDIPDKYAEIPDQAIHCGLSDCNPVGGQWNPNTYQLMFSKCEGKELSMHINRINQRSGFHEVYLCFAGDNRGSLLDLLIYGGYAVQTESTNQEEGLFKQSAFGMRKTAFKNPIIKVHEVFDGNVTHVNSPSHFYMQKIVDGGDLLVRLMNELSETYSRYDVNQGIIFKPYVGMPVAARYLKDTNWYRAIIIKIQESRKIHVKYVDFGNVGLVDLEDIRELLPKFMRTATQALRCSLNDIAPKNPLGWPASAKLAFENMVLNKGLLRVYVEKIVDDNGTSILSIVLYETRVDKYINISGSLVKRGHALSTGQTSACAEYASMPGYAMRVEPTPPDSTSVCSEPSLSSKASSKTSNTTKMLVTKENSTSVELHDIDQDLDGRLKIEVLKIMSPSEIYARSGQLPKQINKLIMEMTSFYAHSEEDESREWSPRDIVAVLKRADNKWYRGIISEISHANYKVYIKDTVDVVDVDRSQLRELDPQFFAVPDGSFRIHLGGLRVPAGMKVWPASTTDYLRRLTEEAEALYIEKLDIPQENPTESLSVRLWRRTQKQEGPLDPLRDEWCDVNASLITLGFALSDNLANGPVLNNLSPEENVATWLDKSFQEQNCEAQLKKETEIEVVAEAPYVSYVSELEKDETLSVKSTNTTKGKVRSTSNRGRFPSQRACYIPAQIGPAGPELITEWKPAAPFKNLHFVGYPTYVDYECNIYVQDIESSKSTLDLLEKAFLSLFEKSEMRPHEETFVEGQICVAFFEPNRKWYRGRVLKVKPEHIEVLFVDYGNVEELQPEELRKQVTMGHIPIQCHKCRTEGIIPISSDGKWPVRSLDFVHGAVVEQLCELKLKAPSETNEDYVILSLKLPSGEDLLDTLLSMHYATYVVDCEEIGVEDKEEEIIVDQEIQLALQNEEIELTQDIESIRSNFELLKVSSINETLSGDNGEHELIEDHVNRLQGMENNYDWYHMVENNIELLVPASSDFISELDTKARLDLKYTNMLLPDSMVEFNVEVVIVCSYNSLKVIITECEDDEMSALIDQFNNLQALIQEEAETMPPLMFPVKDLVCLGCYTEDNTWYRAIIKHVSPGDIISVEYVDYGNVEQVSISRLREIKPEWTLMPVQAMQVTLHNVREGPNYEKTACHQAYMNCLMEPPYTLAIETRFPSLQVELYRSDGEIAYKPVIDAGYIIKD